MNNFTNNDLMITLSETFGLMDIYACTFFNREALSPQQTTKT